MRSNSHRDSWPTSSTTTTLLTRLTGFSVTPHGVLVSARLFVFVPLFWGSEFLFRLPGPIRLAVRC